MLLIATDEAGYGPKLGPLVVAATIGRIATELSETTDEGFDAVFSPMAKPIEIAGHKVRIDDSKSVYKPGSGLTKLHHVVSASHHWCRSPAKGVRESIEQVASADLPGILSTPWLSDIACHELTSEEETGIAIDQWRSGGYELSGIRARIITAREFNRRCQLGANKADLLTRSTLDLVRGAVQESVESKVCVYCDRHGGRRYYADAIEQFFPDSTVSIVSEDKRQSTYEFTVGKREVEISFTVKGDRFAPVALASLHAKYLRERMMEPLNQFFAALHQGKTSLKPTAGYPVDADRFLKQIEPILRQQSIELDDLVRQR